MSKDPTAISRFSSNATAETAAAAGSVQPQDIDLAKILYIYRSERRAGPGLPGEFLYGSDGLAGKGHAVDRIDSHALAVLSGARAVDAPAPGVLASLAARAMPWILPGVPPFALGHFSAGPVAEFLSRYDVIVATTTGLGLGAALAKRLNLFPGRLVVLAMGILADSRPFLERRFCGWLLGAAALATLSQAESRHLRARLGAAARVVDVGFGVDTAFWSPDPEVARERFVLAVGNDLARDWRSLLAAWSPDLPQLTILTRAELGRALPGNVRQIAGSLDKPAVDEYGLRDLYRRAACVVVPLHETIQPSGQSVALQAMACGAPLVISRISGLWDDRMRIDGDICRTVVPSDPAALARAVRELLADGAAAATMADRARSRIEELRGLPTMVDRLDALVSEGGAA